MQMERCILFITEVKLTGLKKTMGMISAESQVRSSVELLTTRIGFLESCGSNRTREVAAIKDVVMSSMNEVQNKFDALRHRIDCKVYEKCGVRFDKIEARIIATVREELSFIATPLPFQHPPSGFKGHSQIGKLVIDGRSSSQTSLNFLGELQKQKKSAAIKSPINTELKIHHGETSKNNKNEPILNQISIHKSKPSVITEDSALSQVADQDEKELDQPVDDNRFLTSEIMFTSPHPDISDTRLHTKILDIDCSVTEAPNQNSNLEISPNDNTSNFEPNIIISHDDLKENEAKQFGGTEVDSETTPRIVSDRSKILDAINVHRVPLISDIPVEGVNAWQ